MVGEFHFVCHECDEEAVVGDRDTVVQLLESHEAATGHRGRFTDITEGRRMA